MRIYSPKLVEIRTNFRVSYANQLSFYLQWMMVA